MKVEWQISRGDIDLVQSFVASMRNDAFVINRLKRNIEGQIPHISESQVWMVLVGCLLTTQQRSGPGSAVNRFMCLEPFPLRLARCRQKPDIESFVAEELTDFGGLRRWKKISIEVKENFRYLETRGWENILRTISSLKEISDPDAERITAHYIAGALKGFGPKQSRNLLQWLGVSKYEIPIDGRITRWLNENLLKFELSAPMLSDSGYYDFVSDGIIALCKRAEIYPCILDAAIFASFDKGKWNAETLRGENLIGCDEL